MIEGKREEGEVIDSTEGRGEKKGNEYVRFLFLTLPLMFSIATAEDPQ